MARDSKIEWTDHTFNPWWGCVRVSPACDHCYAAAMSKRFGYDIWGYKMPRRVMSDSHWKQPLKWNNEAVRQKTRYKVFCASMADVFEWNHELSKIRLKLWDLIEATTNLDWLLLTKRPHLAGRLTPWRYDWPKNVWLGTTVESQKWVQKRLPHLEDSPAAVKFLSCEPLLGQINIERCLDSHTIDWVIVGGESGPGARPTDPNWIRALRDDCIEHQVPFHFKQWGEWSPVDTMHLISDKPNLKVDFKRMSTPMARIGKSRSGRALDGEIWDECPNSLLTHSI